MTAATGAELEASTCTSMRCMPLSPPGRIPQQAKHTLAWSRMAACHRLRRGLAFAAVVPVRDVAVVVDRDRGPAICHPCRDIDVTHVLTHTGSSGPHSGCRPSRDPLALRTRQCSKKATCGGHRRSLDYSNSVPGNRPAHADTKPHGVSTSESDVLSTARLTCMRTDDPYCSLPESSPSNFGGTASAAPHSGHRPDRLPRKS